MGRGTWNPTAWHFRWDNPEDVECAYCYADRPDRDDDEGSWDDFVETVGASLPNGYARLENCVSDIAEYLDGWDPADLRLIGGSRGLVVVVHDTGGGYAVAVLRRNRRPFADPEPRLHAIARALVAEGWQLTVPTGPWTARSFTPRPLRTHRAAKAAE